MDNDRIEGIGHTLKGRVKAWWGRLVGDSKMQAEGKAEQASGRAQNAVGGAKDAWKDMTDEDRG